MVHVGWSALSVALYFAFSLNQASSNGVEDTDECERWRSSPASCFPEPQCSRLYLLSACVWSAAKASITWSMEKFASWTTVQKRQSPNILPTIILKFTWRSSGRSSWLDTSWRQYHFIFIFACIHIPCSCDWFKTCWVLQRSEKEWKGAGRQILAIVCHSRYTRVCLL